MREKTSRGELILILGGARSGKSGFAQKLAMSQDLPVTYVASALPIDEEMRRRIAKHREGRPADWATVEAPYSADEEVVRLCKEKNFVLWDCATVFLSNLLLECHDRGVPVDRVEEYLLPRFERMLCQLESRSGALVVVSNEVGLGVVPEYPLGRAFRDLAGRVNQLLARKADKVFFLMAGIAMETKQYAFDPGNGGKA